MAEPKRHHYVPKMYLDRFAESEGLLVVRRRDGGTFTTGANNIAVESGFYDLDLEGGVVSKEVEHVLSDVEGSAASAIRAIDQTGKAPERGSEERLALAVYLAIQHTRTPQQRERVLFPTRLMDYLDGRKLSADLVAAFLREVHLKTEPSESEVAGAFMYAEAAAVSGEQLGPNFSIALMLRGLPTLVPALEEFEWTVEYDRKGRLITSDAPLVQWRRPSQRDDFEGFGIDGASEIRFPLDPSHQLVLSRARRPPAVRVTPERSTECNIDMVAGCHRFCIATPRNEARLSKLAMRDHHPVLRFNAGPLVQQRTDGSLEDVGTDVMHAWVPRG